jgi:hypothetical protein
MKNKYLLPCIYGFFDVSTCLCALAELESRLKRLSSRHYTGCNNPEGSHSSK